MFAETEAGTKNIIPEFSLRSHERETKVVPSYLGQGSELFLFVVALAVMGCENFPTYEMRL